MCDWVSVHVSEDKTIPSVLGFITYCLVNCQRRNYMDGSNKHAWIEKKDVSYIEMYKCYVQCGNQKQKFIPSQETRCVWKQVDVSLTLVHHLHTAFSNYYWIWYNSAITEFYRDWREGTLQSVDCFWLGMHLCCWLECTVAWFQVHEIPITIKTVYGSLRWGFVLNPQGNV